MESRLKKYIASLSEEEKTLYKPLIEDALRRDKALTLAVAEAKEQAAMYEFQMERLSETTARFQRGHRAAEQEAGAARRTFGAALTRNPPTAPPTGAIRRFGTDARFRLRPETESFDLDDPFRFDAGEVARDAFRAAPALDGHDLPLVPVPQFSRERSRDDMIRRAAAFLRRPGPSGPGG